MNNFKLHHISNNQVLRCSVAAHLKLVSRILNIGNDGINILLVELIKERFRVLHGKRLQHLFSMPGKENFTWCGFWWDEMLSSGQYKEKSLYLAVMFEDTLLAPINDMQLYRV